MDIGLFLPNVSPFATPELLAALGPAAEERGFGALWVPEHVVLFDEHASRYPYTGDGRMPFAGEHGMLEPFTVLAYLAAHTRSIRLGTGIYILPQHNPVHSAKLVATLDWLSGGRVDVGVGVGWLAEEYAALAAPFAARGERCNAYVEVMRTLWQDAVSEYHGPLYDLPACRCYPKPVQSPHPPVYFGGESEAALRRVANLGQGWLGMGLTPDRLPERVRRLEALLAEHARSRGDITIAVSPYLQRAGFDQVARFREAGADQVVLVALAAGADDLARVLDKMATRIVQPAAAL